MQDLSSLSLSNEYLKGILLEYTNPNGPTPYDFSTTVTTLRNIDSTLESQFKNSFLNSNKLSNEWHDVYRKNMMSYRFMSSRSFSHDVAVSGFDRQEDLLSSSMNDRLDDLSKLTSHTDSIIALHRLFK